MKKGRPTDYTPEKAKTICEMIATGKSLVSVCTEMGVGYTTVMQWLKAHPDFAKEYAQAREDQADYHAEEIIDIADDASITPDARRIRIDARKWKAGKMKPKVYGDKLQQELSGPGGAPIETKSTVTLTAEEAYRKMLDGDS
jgi:transposase-like protein